jgi:VIT1/CCC1 family predicted Fe2+/Mn2+ transporter
MLIAALGCNVAWGIVDAVMYLMMQLTDRRTGLRALRALRGTTDSNAAHRILTEALPPLLGTVLSPADTEAIRRRLNELPEPGGPQLPKRAWRGALGVFLLVFLSTLPVVIPFAIFGDVRVAKWVSHVIALAMLFVAGYAFGRVVGYHPALVSLTMVLLGSALVLVTILLGG